MSSLRQKVKAKSVRRQPLHKFAIGAMKRYGKYVIENRALADYRDGLKPVQRRILWAMLEAKFLANGPCVKSARVTGEVMGKYHPHGSSYGVIVNMVNAPVSLIFKQGNYGFFNEKPASERYTECRLNKYSSNIMLDSSYLAVSKMMPNYDGNFQEPLVLPALLPNILLNGSEGIAVGVIMGIPAFAKEGVIDIVKVALKRPVTVKDCCKLLRVSYPDPFKPEVVTSDDDLKEFYRTGSGRLTLGVGYETHNNTMTIKRFPPKFEISRGITKLMDIDEVYSAEDHTDKKDKGNSTLLVTLKSSVPVMGRAEIFKKCADKLNESTNLRINIIKRLGEEKVKFYKWDMPTLINKWTEWRVDLEVKRNIHVAEELQKVIDNLQLALLACDNLDKIIPIIKSRKPDVDERLAKALNISLIQAKYILSLTLRRLTGLSREDLINQIKEKQKQHKKAVYDSLHPVDKVLEDIDGLAEFI